MVALNVSLSRSQSGAVLVVGLLLLLIMTVLALGASNSTRLQERMAGNQRDMDVALQGAEAGLRGAEIVLAPTNLTITRCITPAADCDTYEKDVLPTDLAHTVATWTDYGSNFSESLVHIAEPPQFVIEHVGEVRDSLATGGPYLLMVRDMHRATARSHGFTDTAEVALQTSHARVSFE